MLICCVTVNTYIRVEVIVLSSRISRVTVIVLSSRISRVTVIVLSSRISRVTVIVLYSRSVLASDTLQRYCNVISENCNVFFNLK